MAETINVELTHAEAQVTIDIFRDIVGIEHKNDPQLLAKLFNVDRIQNAVATLRKIQKGVRLRTHHLETTQSSTRELSTAKSNEQARLENENRQLKEQLRSYEALVTDLKKAEQMENHRMISTLLNTQEEYLVNEDN